jgi:putative transposase
MNSVSFVSGNRSVGLNQFHLEWCPKYRKAFMKKELVSFIESSLINTSRKYGIIIHNLHVGSDHIHMFVSLPFDISISEAFRLLKGRSSYELRKAFPQLNHTFRKGHLWSPGKFCRSISNVKAQTIKSYIENHQFKELNTSIQEAKAEAEQMKLSSFF